MSKVNSTPTVPALEHSTRARSVQDEKIAYPFPEALDLIGIGRTKGHELISPGDNGEPPQLASFMIGRCRYVARTELERFIKGRIQESTRELASDRAAKVKPAVEGRARQRQAAAA